ncbi:MAG: class I SAM-dependent methyltransferase [Acidilobaceae archaeon]|nr:class I SAM-dependent methyltransferase [Acidilobaceae archaeon]
MSTADLFEESAEEYDKWYERHPEIAESEARLVELMMKDAPRPALEVGVGSGFFAARAGVEVGLDPAAAMLRLARKRVNHLVRGTGEHLPFADSSLGSVLIVVTLCFAEDPVEMLKEAHRALKEGGVVVVCVIPRDSSWGSLYAELGRRGHKYYSRARLYSKQEVIYMLKAAGFLVERAAGVLRSPPPSAKLEEPSEELEGAGFVCIRGAKVR